MALPPTEWPVVCVFLLGKKGWGFGGEWGSASHVFVVGSENINAENR